MVYIYQVEHLTALTYKSPPVHKVPKPKEPEEKRGADLKSIRAEI